MSADTRVARYQWMRCKEGGQTFGNQTTIQPLTDELFERFVAPIVGRSRAAWCAAHPEDTHISTFNRGHDGEVVLDSFGSYYELIAGLELCRVHYGWVLRVDDFEAPIAKLFGAIADSEASTPKA